MKHPFAQLAINTAQKAGDLLMEYYGKLTPDKIFYKGTYDLVTEADRETEKLIVGEISAVYPDHSLLGEEFTAKEGRSSYRWVIDPLDGTNNFAHNLPFFAVSIGLLNDNRPELGVVYAPYCREMFYAAVGEGAFLNGQEIRVSAIADLEHALLATGFPYQRKKTQHNNIDNFCRLLMNIQGIRRCGAAAIDLCYVACGRYDGFWEMWLQAHDVAAAIVIIKEAGGKISDFAGGENYIFAKNIIASNGKIHEDIRRQLTPVDEEVWKQDIK